MNDRGFWLGEEAVDFWIGALVLLALVGFAGMLFFVSRGEQANAQAELISLESYLQELSPQRAGPVSYPVLQAKEWFLISTEYNQLCGGPGFCLCLCETLDCEGTSEKACISTERYVLLQPIGTAFPQHSVRYDASHVTLTLANEEVYPYSAYDFSLVGPSDSLSGVIARDVGTLFFKYGRLEGKAIDEWMWSPDLVHWKGMDETSITEVPWTEQDFFDTKARFIRDAMYPLRTDKARGLVELAKVGAQLSQGVIFMEVPPVT